jgi:carboxylesterase
VSNEKKEPEGFDEEELIRSEFESIVSGLSLDQSAPTTYLDDLDRIDNEGFVHPNPVRHNSLAWIYSIRHAMP